MQFINSFLTKTERIIWKKWKEKDLSFCFKQNFNNKTLYYDNEVLIELIYIKSVLKNNKIFTYFYENKINFKLNVNIKTLFKKEFIFSKNEESIINDPLITEYNDIILFDIYANNNLPFPAWLKEKIININNEKCEWFYKLNKNIFEENKKYEIILNDNIKKLKSLKEEKETELFLTSDFNLIKKKLLNKKIFSLEQEISSHEESLKRCICFIEENKKIKKEIFKFKSKLTKYI